jgi:hypothetical protein
MAQVLWRYSREGRLNDRTISPDGKSIRRQDLQDPGARGGDGAKAFGVRRMDGLLEYWVSESNGVLRMKSSITPTLLHSNFLEQ